MAFEVVGSKWNLAIIGALFDGPKRFTEIQKRIGNARDGNINSKTITKHLKFLENHKILTRTVYPEVPPRVVYELTELGRTLIPILISILEWGKSVQHTG